VAAIQQLRAQLTGEAGRKLTPQQRRELRDLMREQMRQLTPMERRELDKERREQMKKYFSMPKKDKIAYFDQQIKRMQAARRLWQAQANNSLRPNIVNFGPRLRPLIPRNVISGGERDWTSGRPSNARIARNSAKIWISAARNVAWRRCAG